MKALLFCSLMTASFCVQKIYGQNTYESEKVFLVTDKDNYMPSDTIWVKAFIFDAARSYLSKKSSVLYFSILDAKNKELVAQKGLIEDGQSSFYTVLPKTISETRYDIVAYTGLMLNQDPDLFFHKTINIVNYQNQIVAEKSVSNKISVQFFPEGGHMVLNIASRVAFKATDANGMGVDIKGHIKNTAGEVLTDFKSDYLGIGVLNLTPKMNESYTAEIDGIGYELPVAKDVGHVLKIDNVNTKDGMKVEVHSTQKDEQSMHLWMQQNGEVISKTTFKIDALKKTFNVKSWEIPADGILVFTLFDHKMQAVAERVVFSYEQKNDMTIDLKSKSRISFRDSVEIEIETKNTKGQMIPHAQICLAAVDAMQETPNMEKPDLKTYLLLNAELKGFIEKPNSYFKIDGARYYLDNLMLSQGWRKYNSKNEDLNPDISLQMRGTIYRNNKKVDNEPIFLSTWDQKGFKINVVQTDNEGRFVLNDKWQGRVKIISTDKKNRAVKLVMEEEYMPKAKITPIQTKNTTDVTLLTTATKIKEFENVEAIMLEELTVKAAKIDPLKEDGRRLMYGGQPDVSIEVTPEMINGAVSVTQMLEGRIVGIRPGELSKDENAEIPPIPDNILRGGPPTNTSISGSMMTSKSKLLILVDGVRIPGSYVNTIPVTMIDRVDLLRNAANTSAYGLQGSDGKVINILTKRGLDFTPAFASKSITEWNGYASNKEFYSPAYIVNHSSKPDYRSTIYWAANLKTDENGKLKVKFLNTDIAQKIVINVTGTNGEGLLGSNQITIGQ